MNSSTIEFVSLIWYISMSMGSFVSSAVLNFTSGEERERAPALNLFSFKAFAKRGKESEERRGKEEVWC